MFLWLQTLYHSGCWKSRCFRRNFVIKIDLPTKRKTLSHPDRAACKELCLNTLHARRQSLCKKFAKKSFKHQKFSKWFKLNEKKTKTRHKQPKLCNVVCRTSRFQKSPISYLTNILNKLADWNLLTLHCWKWIIGHRRICFEDTALCLLLYVLIWTISLDK